MDTTDLQSRIIAFIAQKNAEGAKPHTGDLAAALSLPQDEVGRAIRPLIDSGEVSAERWTPGDDGYWASGLEASHAGSSRPPAQAVRPAVPASL